MDDHELVERIDGLVAEERRLSQAHAGDGLSAEDKARLDRLEVQLDQAWDLLRQRRAQREVGGDPDLAAERPSSTVEGYLQ
jgi:hypothetical protein